MSSRTDGFVTTWRYTAVSLWFYVAIGLAGPVARSVMDIVEGTAPVRALLLLAVIAAVVQYSCRPLVHAARKGLGSESMSWRERARLLAPSLLVFPLAWWPPTFPPGIAIVPWVVVCLLAVDIAPRLRNRLLVVTLPLLVGVYAVFGWRELTELDVQGAYALLFLAVFVAGMVVFQLWLWQLMLQVRASGESEARLAAVRERLRLAADLHDVQGHHLQVIALKAELAERRLDQDPVAARVTMAEVQQIARNAINETKEIVRGYRRTSLRDEMVNAAAVLEASGADVTLDCPDEVDQPLFALTLREATTNILRHSDATWVRIEAQPHRFSVTNDGVVAPGGAAGSGLASLTERVATGGGRLSTRSENGTFTVEVVL